MGKTRGASKPDPPTEAPEKCSDSLFDNIWARLETKLNTWIMNTLPTLVKDLIKEKAIKAVDEYVSSPAFQNSLPETIQFDSEALKDSQESSKKKINELEDAKLDLLNQLDDLEQYTRRTNIRIFGILESSGDAQEDTDVLATQWVANELGVELLPSDISRSHRVGKRSTAKPRPIIVRLTRHNKKVEILKNRRQLKINKRPFNVQEDLTLARRGILYHLRHEINDEIVDKVWTIDGVVFFRPTRHSSTIERCSTLVKCKELIRKYTT